MSEWEKNLVFIDAEGVEGAEARERDRQLADPIIRQHQLLLLHFLKVSSLTNPSNSPLSLLFEQ